MLGVAENERAGGAGICCDYDCSIRKGMQNDIRQLARRLCVKKWEHMESVN